MPTKAKPGRAEASQRPVQSAGPAVLAGLKRLSRPRIREEMSSRDGIVTKDAYGVRMRDLQAVAKKLGRNHALALARKRSLNKAIRAAAQNLAKAA